MASTGGLAEMPSAGDDMLALAVQLGHDARSPLTAICSYAECLAWLASLDPLTRERYARGIMVETRRVNRMLADFMVLAGHRRLSPPQELNLSNMLAGAFDEVADLADLRGIELVSEVSGPYPTVVWPPEILGQALLAALDCMLVAANEHAAVRVTVAAAGPTGAQLTLTTGEEAMLMDLPRLLSYRAAAVLLAERGGELSRLPQELMGIALRVPADGRSVTAARPDGLQRAVS
jgi:hypothetical protein